MSDKIRVAGGKHGFQNRRIESTLLEGFAEGEPRGSSLLTSKETLDLRWIEESGHGTRSSAIARASSGLKQLPDPVLHAEG